MSSLAALWLLGLWVAAPLLRRDATYGTADRLRDALVLGVAMPFVLALAHLLFPWTLWCALGLCAIAGAVRERRERVNTPREPMPYLLIAALALVITPPLLEPMLDGDSLRYHLPNAALWVHAHSFAPTGTVYWWYPPASELFASGLFAVAGPFVLGWSGALALALLGLRAAAIARERLGASPLLADAAAAALVTLLPNALQAGSLQNDVWLAAFLLETAWTSSAPAAAVAALLKPSGWIYTACALIAARSPLSRWAAPIAVCAIWAVHVAARSPHALFPAGANASVWRTTILANSTTALPVFVRVCLRQAPLGLLAWIAALAAPFVRRARLAFAPLAALFAFAFLVTPWSYANAIDQLSSGASLRFAAPAFAFGMLILVALARPFERFAVPLFIASALYGAGSVVAIYWFDEPTRSALGVALLALGLAWIAARARLRLLLPAAVALAVVCAAPIAARGPAAYFANALRRGETRSGLFAWIAAHRPARVMTLGLRAGSAIVLSPQTIALDAPSAGACAAARNAGALLIVYDARTPPCGNVVYRDALALVEAP